MATLTLAILSAVLIHLTPSATAYGNVLLTGETLYPDQQLTYDGSSLVMQSDCNLVLYNEGHGRRVNIYGVGPANCTLSFTENGRLIIRRTNGSTVWITPNFYSQNGSYAAVLRPDGEVAIYGRELWHTDIPVPYVARHAPGGLGNAPMVKNLLFSGQILYGNEKMKSRDYSLVMKNNCNLVLNKTGGNGAVWQTGTSGNGKYCFLRLDYHGLIVILDDGYRTVWSSKYQSKMGEYVLVLQDNGQAVVYGPEVWSTASTPNFWSIASGGGDDRKNTAVAEQ